MTYPPNGPSGPPQQPPPGAQQGYSQQGQPTMYLGQPQRPAGRATAPRARGLGAVWVLGAVSVVAVVLGLSLDENGANAWHSVHAWGGVAVIGALLTLAPALGPSLGVTAARSWQACAVGAGALVLFWVLFVLPAVGTNTSLLTTIGVAAGVIAAWTAPGRPAPAGQGTPGAGTW